MPTACQHGSGCAGLTAACAGQVREYGIHRTLRHASIVALTDLFEIDAAAFATVLELCPSGDLDAHLQRHQARCRAPLPLCWDHEMCLQ